MEVDLNFIPFIMNTTQSSAISETLKTIYERRAVRKFKKKPVEKQLILDLLDAARMAPSAMNKQPWHFYVLTDPAKILQCSKAIMSETKLKMLKAGVKEVVHHIFHPGSFHIKDGMDFFKGEDPIFHGAPVVIFISSDRSNDWAKLDIGMCAQNIMLAAKSLGLDTCAVGLAKFIEFTAEYKTFGVSASEQIELAVVVGYGDEKPALHERKKDNVHFIDE